MATSLGGATLREPAECVRSCDSVPVQKRMADGTLKTYGAIKYRWSLSWSNIPSADASTIDGKAILYTSQTFVPPDGGSYSVMVEPGSYSNTVGKKSGIYNISLGLKQV